MKSPPKFERLFLGCIDASDSEYWRIVPHVSRSTRCTDYSFASLAAPERDHFVREGHVRGRDRAGQAEVGDLRRRA